MNAGDRAEPFVHNHLVLRSKVTSYLQRCVYECNAFDLALLIGGRGTQMIDLMIDLALLIGGDELVVMDVCLTLN